MQVLYDIFIVVLGLGIKLASFFNKKVALLYNGRKTSFDLISQKIDDSSQVIWMHCASLGEFEQGKPVFEALKLKYPTYSFALSFFSPSGFEICKNYALADVVFYLPLDSKKNAEQLIQLLNPKILILVKYDYWYNLISVLQKRKIQIVVISAIFRTNQIFFSFYGKWFLDKLTQINHFFVQNLASEQLLNQHGISQTTISGDTRYDAVRSLKNNAKNIPFLDIFCENHKIIVVGSSWENDEKLWIKYINNELQKGVKIIIAPHEINKTKIEKLKNLINKKSICYSEINQEKLIADELRQAKVVILNTVGLLKNVYSYATIAYVGGGLNKTGVHNVLEPATYGIPVIYGANFKKYQEAIDLVSCKGGFVVKNHADLQQILTSLLSSSSLLLEAGKNARNLVESAPKSTEIIVENLIV